MSNVFRINLPLPSPELISTVQNYASSIAFDPDKKRWLDEFHSNTINSSLHHFDSPEFLTQLIRQEYQHIFPKHKLGGMIGIMSNANDTPACLPPHCDRGRAVGLNYFITLGGSDVQTVLYDREETIVGVAKNISYSEITPIETQIFDQDSWFCFNTSRYHSVENLESTRLFIAIRLVRAELTAEVDFDYTLSDFLDDYPQYIVDIKRK